MRNIKIRLLQRTELYKEDMAALIKLTFINKPFEDLYEELEGQDQNLIDNIIDMDHQSITEHGGFTFLLEGVSRTFLAQTTRHRIASYTSKSQQYQDHSEFPYLVPDGIKHAGLHVVQAYHNFMKASNEFYEQLIKNYGVDKDEARYVLPNACRVNLVITCNTRSLYNYFLQRCCRRNTIEMSFVARKMLRLLVTPNISGYDYKWLFHKAGPACLRFGKCNQGHKTCGKPYKNLTELIDLGDEHGGGQNCSQGI